MDINLVQHAKDYIYDLARGINPLTKQAIPDDEVVNNVKISRCLFYLSDILEEVITNGGVEKSVKPKKADFSAEAIDFSKFRFSKKPLTISIIVKEINEHKPETMKKLKTTAITNWLVDIGVLNIVQINGKNHKRPTIEGNKIGIVLEERFGEYAPYSVVTYSEGAQHFIIDNLAAIIAGGYNERSSKEKTDKIIITENNDVENNAIEKNEEHSKRINKPNLNIYVND